MSHAYYYRIINLVAGCLVMWCPCVEMCNIANALEEKWKCCLCCCSMNHCHDTCCLAPVRTKTRVMTGVRVSKRI